jgi:hypothetical protein
MVSRREILSPWRNSRHGEDNPAGLFREKSLSGHASKRQTLGISL